MAPTRLLAALGAMIVAAGIGFWAASTTLTAPEVEAHATPTPRYEVELGTLQRSLSFTATAKWDRKLAGRGGGQGVITHLSLNSAVPAAEGAKLLEINERPVVLAQGVVPMYEDLTLESTGQVVTQLQAFLGRQGFYPYGLTGEFDYATRSAVMTWQRDLGVAVDGHVQRGDIIFVPGPLPRRVALEPDLEVGSEVAANGILVDYLAVAPVFQVELAAEQRDLVPLDANVRVRADGLVWPGRIGSAEQANSGELILRLEGRDAGALCAHSCDRVQTTGVSQFPVEIVVVPRTKGPVVPAAALKSGTGGDTLVVDGSGREIPVDIIASDGGWSVVRGVEVGQSLTLFGSAS